MGVQAQPPPPEDLAAELAGLLRRGATPTAVRNCPAILGLAVIAATSASDSPDDRAVAAHAILRQVVIAVDGERDGPAATLLALAAGTRGSLPKRRRELAALQLGVSVDHFRREREEPLIVEIADELYATDSAHRLRQRHRDRPEREAHQSRLGIDWKDRHQAYRRVWTPITALRDDLYVLLRFLRQDADWPDLADRAMNLSWRYAQFSRELNRFVNDYGGLWVLADVESEVAAADAIHRIGFHLPLGDADASWLRLTLADAPNQELDPFIDKLLATRDRANELMHAWINWARTCPCDLDHPDPQNCEVHRWASYTDQFIRLIDRDWYRIADYYRATDADIHSEDIRELWETTAKTPEE